MRILFRCAATDSCGRLLVVFSVVTLEGVAVFYGTIFEIVIPICCITPRGVTLGDGTLLVIVGVTCAVGWDGVDAYTIGSGSMNDVILHSLISILVFLCNFKCNTILLTRIG